MGGIHVTDQGYTVNNVSFYNFEGGCYGIGQRLEEHGTTTSALRTENLVWENSPNKVIITLFILVIHLCITFEN